MTSTRSYASAARGYLAREFDRDKFTPTPLARMRSFHGTDAEGPPGAPKKAPTIAPQLGPGDILPYPLPPAVSELSAQDKEYAGQVSYVPKADYDPTKHGEKATLITCENSGRQYYTNMRAMVHRVDPEPAPPPPPSPTGDAVLVDKEALPDVSASEEAIYGGRKEEEEVWEMVDRMALTDKGKTALDSSGYTDPAECTPKELTTLLDRECCIPPPPPDTGSVFSGMDPKSFHALAVYLRPQLLKSVVEPHRFAGVSTTTSMLRASAELAALAQAQGDRAHAEQATSMGLANFQLALALVGMMTAPNSSAQRQLLNHVTGGVTPEHVVKVLQDPKYVTMFWTFDQHAEQQCEGTRMDTPLAELTKQRMLAISHPGTLQIESRSGNPNDCVDEINEFCSKGTNGMIPEIVTELDPDCVAGLLCCVYLKVSWAMEGKRMPPMPFYEHPGPQSASIGLDLSESAYGAAPGRRSLGGQLLSKQRYFTYSKQHFNCWMHNVTRVYWLMLECKPDEETGAERFMLFGLPHPDSADPENDVYASMARLSMDKFVSCKFDTVILPCVDVGENELDGKSMLKKNDVFDIFNDVKALPMMFWSPRGDAGVVVERIIHKSKIKWDRKGAEAAAATLVEFAYA